MWRQAAQSWSTRLAFLQAALWWSEFQAAAIYTFDTFDTFTARPMHPPDILPLLVPQRLLVVGAPLCLSWYLSQPAHCFTTSVIPIQPTQSAQPERHVLLRAVDSVADELAMMARAVYLLLLFMPAAVTAPLCMMLEWRRRDWLHLMRWTLERAGALILAATLTSKPHQPTMCDRAANEPLLV